MPLQCFSHSLTKRALTRATRTINRYHRGNSRHHFFLSPDSQNINSGYYSVAIARIVTFHRKYPGKISYMPNNHTMQYQEITKKTKQGVLATERRREK
jgi:hypothetical protein